MKFADSNRSGYIALISILIISTIGLIIAFSFAQEGVESGKILAARNKGHQALMNASACAEEALVALRQDLSYPGDESFNLDEGTCEVRPVATTTDEFIVQTIGAVDNYTNRIEVIVGTTSPYMEIKSWQQVKNF